MRFGATLDRFMHLNRQTPALLWSFAYFFCLLSGYYVLRPVRDAMGASSEVEAVFPSAMIAFFAKGLNLALDFTGGSLVEVEFAQAADNEVIRKKLEAGGFEGGPRSGYFAGCAVSLWCRPTAGKHPC